MLDAIKLGDPTSGGLESRNSAVGNPHGGRCSASSLITVRVNPSDLVDFMQLLVGRYLPLPLFGSLRVIPQEGHSLTVGFRNSVFGSGLRGKLFVACLLLMVLLTSFNIRSGLLSEL